MKETEKKKSKTTAKVKQKKSKRISIYSLVIISVVIIALIMGVRYLFIQLKYGEYTEKMDMYNLNKAYNNEKATAWQTVTKSEMVKVVLYSLIGEEDVNSYTTQFTETYPNSKYVKCAEMLGIIEEGYITEENESDRAREVDTSVMIVKAVQKLLGKEVKVTGKSVYSNIKDYKENKLEIIKAGDNGILEKTQGKLNNTKIIKGQLNKMLIPYVERYGTLHYEGTVGFITNKEDQPKNADEYPYILSSIDKEVYEIPFECFAESRYMNPKGEYEFRGQVYSQIDEYITDYFDTILNVNYKTIDSKTFLKDIEHTLYYGYTDEAMADYIKHVKDNKIILAGSAEVLLPIIYNDGEQNRVRTHITFKVISSDTKNNLLLQDNFGTEDIQYIKGSTYDFYCDIPMGVIPGSKTLKMQLIPLADYIVTENAGVKKIIEN